MNRCTHYEMILSAVMDGEASRAEVLQLLDHLPDCARCRLFLDACRDLQAAAAGATRTEHGAIAPAHHRRFPVALALAASVVLALGFALGRIGRAPAWARDSGSAVETVGVPMTEDRFVACARALLQADPRFQVAMLEFLSAVMGADTEGSRERELANEDEWTIGLEPPGARELDFASTEVPAAALPQ